MWRKLLERFKPNQKKAERHPKNASGPFFVENGHCMACGAPEAEAPGLMAHDEDTYDQCYFKRQPSTPEETIQAINACRVSCCEAVRYGGNDPEILRLLDDK